MGMISLPAPVKLFAGLIASSPERMAEAEALLAVRWGAVEPASEIIPFTFTGYYADEMGPSLLRRWVGFERLVAPGELPVLKMAANGMEEGFAAGGRRQVNIDPGYLTMAKLVLASTKDFSHRLFLADGIYGEVTLIYKHNEFTPLPWTYPDYQSPAAVRFFKGLRERYHRQLKQG